MALGRVRVNSAIISSSRPFGTGGPELVTAPGISVLNDSRIKAGFAAGGGIEWQLGSFGLFSSPFFKDLSFKAEALYYDLGRSNLDTLVQQNRCGHPDYQHRHSHYLAQQRRDRPRRHQLPHPLV